MITLEKLQVYERLGSNEDAWARAPEPTLSSQEWYLIESLVSEIVAVNAGLTSSDYTRAFRQRLAEACDAPSTEEVLLMVARKLTSTKR